LNSPRSSRPDHFDISCGFQPPISFPAAQSESVQLSTASPASRTSLRVVQRFTKPFDNIQKVIDAHCTLMLFQSAYPESDAPACLESQRARCCPHRCCCRHPRRPHGFLFSFFDFQFPLKPFRINTYKKACQNKEPSLESTTHERHGVRGVMVNQLSFDFKNASNIQERRGARS